MRRKWAAATAEQPDSAEAKLVHPRRMAYRPLETDSGNVVHRNGFPFLAFSYTELKMRMCATVRIYRRLFASHTQRDGYCPRVVRAPVKSLHPFPELRRHRLVPQRPRQYHVAARPDLLRRLSPQPPSGCARTPRRRHRRPSMSAGKPVQVAVVGNLRPGGAHTAVEAVVVGILVEAYGCGCRCTWSA